jgi:hypothetical protein
MSVRINPPTSTRKKTTNGADIPPVIPASACVFPNLTAMATSAEKTALIRSSAPR